MSLNYQRGSYSIPRLQQITNEGTKIKFKICWNRKCNNLKDRIEEFLIFGHLKNEIKRDDARIDGNGLVEERGDQRNIGHRC